MRQPCAASPTSGHQARRLPRDRSSALQYCRLANLLPNLTGSLLRLHESGPCTQEPHLSRSPACSELKKQETNDRARLPIGFGLQDTEGISSPCIGLIIASG